MNLASQRKSSMQAPTPFLSSQDEEPCLQHVWEFPQWKHACCVRGLHDTIAGGSPKTIRCCAGFLDVFSKNQTCRWNVDRKEDKLVRIACPAKRAFTVAWWLIKDHNGKLSVYEDANVDSLIPKVCVCRGVSWTVLRWSHEKRAGCHVSPTSCSFLFLSSWSVLSSSAS